MSTRQRLCLLSGEYPPRPGGVGDYTHQLALALRGRGHEVAVLTIQDGHLVSCAPPPGAPSEAEFAHPVPGARPGLDWSPRCWPAVIAAIDGLRPTWLHIQYQTGAYAMRPGVNLLPWRLRSLPARPRIAVTFHDLLRPYLFPKAGPVRGWVNRRLAVDADAVVATNDADAAELRRTLPAARPPVVIPIGSNIVVSPPHPYSRAAWRERAGASPGELLVAYFGLLSPSKGADLLVEALALLKRPWRLMIIGGAATAPQDQAYAAALRARINALGLASRTSTTGHVAATEVSAWLLAADCVALPFTDGASFRRGSLLAALAHGCPVITTEPPDSATRGMLTDTAVLVPPGDRAALLAALERLATDGALRATLAAAGPPLAARFSWEMIAAQHEALYNTPAPIRGHP